METEYRKKFKSEPYFVIAILLYDGFFKNQI